MADLEPRNFLQPCLLLLLKEQPAHGYELAGRLRPLHDGAEAEAGGVYRALRGLERHGLVASQWETSAVGPARRTYHITGLGQDVLNDHVRGLERTHESLHLFLERYSRLCQPSWPRPREA
jgi:poly-beta-hydroxybutyrate-responsive repressor